MKGVQIGRVKPPYDLSPLTLVSHRYKFIYIGIPKVATRSFKTSFHDTNAESFESEIFETKRDFKKVLKAYPDYLIFTFTRNPYARALSCYNSKIGHKNVSMKKRARILSFYKGLTPGMSFEDFAIWLNSDEGRDERADRHWMSQHRFVLDGSGRNICDFVGRYECLEDDLNYILHKIGAPTVELQQAGWISGSEGYKDTYTTRAKEEISKRYKDDLSLFKYKY
ncbi:MAG: sulfotransferase family protein [Alphaproteobacteria bacterium]